MNVILIAVLGSVFFQVVRLLERITSGRGIPALYRRPTLWLVRSLYALTGAVIAYSWLADNPMYAFALGAMTPVIIRNTVRNVIRLDAFLADPFRPHPYQHSVREANIWIGSF